MAGPATYCWWCRTALLCFALFLSFCTVILLSRQVGNNFVSTQELTLSPLTRPCALICVSQMQKKPEILYNFLLETMTYVQSSQARIRIAACNLAGDGWLLRMLEPSGQGIGDGWSTDKGSSGPPCSWGCKLPCQSVFFTGMGVGCCGTESQL